MIPFFTFIFIKSAAPWNFFPFITSLAARSCTLIRRALQAWKWTGGSER